MSATLFTLRFGRALLGILCWAGAVVATAQTADTDPLRVSPRGLTDSARAAPEVPPAPVNPINPATATDAATLLGSGVEPGQPPMFGQQLFRGLGGQSFGTGFNRDYTLAIGDRVTLRMWGAFTLDTVQTVDAQGNVFIPNVGPVRLAGVRNEEIDTAVRSAIARIYRNNVGVYAALEASQPVRVFVTGFVQAPGQYAGVAAESVLGFLNRAGGVDPRRGSYIDVRLVRSGRDRASFDLYRFLLEGRLEAVQLQDGDTLVVGPRRNTVAVSGDVFNAYAFEFSGERLPATELLRLARAKPSATHLSIVRKTGARQVAEYQPIDRLDGVLLHPGDEVAVVSDRSLGTILVRVDGATDGSRVLTLPHGARLRDALERVTPSPLAQMDALQLYRLSVAKRQKEMLEVSFRGLETYALTARSATSEEASLRTREAELLMRFVDRARGVQPRGQVVLAAREGALDGLMEDGDVIYIPERSSMVMVHGEVSFPNAIAWDSKSSVADYLKLAGGTTQEIDATRVMLLRRDGSFEEGMKSQPNPGDEIMVLPKVGAKNIEVTRGITTIIYQIAIAAKVILGL